MDVSTPRLRASSGRRWVGRTRATARTGRSPVAGTITLSGDGGSLDPVRISDHSNGRAISLQGEDQPNRTVAIGHTMLP
jgi:hypothetical protein